MAVVTSIGQQALTADLDLSTSDFTHLVSTVSFSLLATATISIDAYAIGLDPASVEMQLVIDGTVVVDGPAQVDMSFNAVLGAGSHTINYQALAFNSGTVATARGIKVLNLTTGI